MLIADDARLSESKISFLAPSLQPVNTTTTEMNSQQPTRKSWLDPRWQRKRPEIFQRDNLKCQCRGDTTTQQIHHTEYFEGLEPWDYPDDMLITARHKCHKEEQVRPRHETYLLQSLKSRDIWHLISLAIASMVDTTSRSMNFYSAI